MPSKKKSLRPRARREYDLKAGILRMHNNRGKTYEYSFNGLRSDVFLKLAMIGAGGILCKEKNPMLKWEKIRQNMFGRERDYSKVEKWVQALSTVENIPLEEAIRKVKYMTPLEKREARTHKLIRIELKRMEIKALESEIG